VTLRARPHFNEFARAEKPSCEPISRRKDTVERPTKPDTCRKCGRELEHPETGRPKNYCGEGCRRAREYELRRSSATSRTSRAGSGG
jgi:hypothetical protein